VCVCDATCPPPLLFVTYLFEDRKENEDWNKVYEAQVFEYFLPGEYSFDVYAKRQYHNGRSNRGSRNLKAVDINILE
jgi:hypothetical protein